MSERQRKREREENEAIGLYFRTFWMIFMSPNVYFNSWISQGATKILLSIIALPFLQHCMLSPVSDWCVKSVALIIWPTFHLVIFYSYLILTRCTVHLRQWFHVTVRETKFVLTKNRPMDWSCSYNALRFECCPHLLFPFPFPVTKLQVLPT